jgi:TPR repeat protein
MLISAADLAYMKGEGAAQPGDEATAERALTKAAEHGYLVPDARRAAFVQGFLGERPSFTAPTRSRV